QTRPKRARPEEPQGSEESDPRALGNNRQLLSVAPNPMLTDELTASRKLPGSRTNAGPFSRLHGGPAQRPGMLTGKYPQGEWVGEAPGGACGAGSCCAGVDPGGVVVGAEVGVAGGGVVEHVPDDDQDRAGDSDERLEFAAAFDDAPVAFAEEGVGFRGRGGGLAERPFEIRVAPAGLATALDRSGLDGAWTQFGPRHQVRGGGEPAHVEPDLGENDLRESRADAGNLVESLDRGRLAGTVGARASAA